MIRTSLLAAVVASFALPALADITISGPYARVSTPMSKSGAAFMVINNTGDSADRLISASSDVAERVELHTHRDDGKGNMQMVEVPEGFEIPAHGTHALARGSDHVMFMGLHRSLKQGDQVAVTLHFEQAGDVAVTIPVDLSKQAGAGMDHSQMDHSKMKMPTN